MELNIDGLVLEKHEANQKTLVMLTCEFRRGWLTTYVHGYRDNHKLRIEAHERLVLCETNLINKPDLNNAQKVPVETSVDDEDEYLGNLIPDIVDLDKSVADRWRSVCGNPDTEDSDIDGGDDNDCTPLYIADSVSVFSDQCNSIDDDLHEQLDLEDPEEEDKEEDWDTVFSLA